MYLEDEMKKMIPLVLVFASLTAAAAGELEKMPRELETKFALSALPPYLREGATVLSLDPKRGYQVDRKGSNGFTCLVERTEWAKEEYREDIYTPLCFDAAGSNHLKVWTDIASFRAKGVGPRELRAKVLKRFEKGIYRAPSRPGLSYMVAPLMRSYPSPDPADKTVVTMSMPHLMFYAPNLSYAEAGPARPPTPYPFLFEPGPHGYLIQLIGETEKTQILAENQSLVKELCEYRSFLCLTPAHRHE
jgi:hypothetical protein